MTDAKIILKNMTGQELYNEGQKRLSNQLGATQYSGVHSQDIRRVVFKNYILLAAESGYLPAIKDTVDYYIDCKKYTTAAKWAMKYKKSTGYNNLKMLAVFGTSIMKLAFYRG